MKPTAELREDHTILRAKLDLLEGLLPLAQTMQFPIRDLVYSISRRLGCHTAKEEVLLSSLRDTRRGEACSLTMQRHLSAEHRDQRETLGMLEELLAQGPVCPADAVMAYGAHLIDELREHMALEETRLFPAADRLVPPDQEEAMMQQMHGIAQWHYPEGEPRSSATRRATPITQEMTVNHVLWMCPETRKIFKIFQADCAADGGCCLDEFCWRRGADLPALLEALNRRIAEHPQDSGYLAG